MTDLTVPKTILQQLGGNRFIAMTGAKNIIGGENFLMFAIGRNSKRINKVKITLTPGDLYRVEFIRVRKFEFTVVETRDDVYVGELRNVFTAGTGMDTHL